MAITGLFLSFFLVIHLLGNLQLLLPADQAQTQFNAYAALLSELLLIKIISYGLYFSILAHAVWGIYLYIKSKKANGSKYAFDRRARASNWASRNMTFLGSIIFLFLVIHMKHFWFEYKFGNVSIDSNGHKDIYSLVIVGFSKWWYVLIYIIGILAVGFHLLHGVFSAHRSLGVYNPIYSKAVKLAGAGFAILITLGFILIPIFIYFNQS